MGKGGGRGWLEGDGALPSKVQQLTNVYGTCGTAMFRRALYAWLRWGEMTHISKLKKTPQTHVVHIINKRHVYDSPVGRRAHLSLSL